MTFLFCYHTDSSLDSELLSIYENILVLKMVSQDVSQGLILGAFKHFKPCKYEPAMECLKNERFVDVCKNAREYLCDETSNLIVAHNLRHVMAQNLIQASDQTILGEIPKELCGFMANKYILHNPTW